MLNCKGRPNHTHDAPVCRFRYADENGLAHIETSALDNSNIQAAFSRVLAEVYNVMREQQATAATRSVPAEAALRLAPAGVDVNSQQQSSGGCGCG